MWDLLLAAAAWYLCGVAGFLYWWTADFPADARTLREALMLGVLGPVTVVGGWLIHHALPPTPALRPIRVRSDDRRRRR